MSTNTWILAEGATGTVTIHHPRRGDPAVTTPLPDGVPQTGLVDPGAVEAGSTVVATVRVASVVETPGQDGASVRLEVTNVDETVDTDGAPDDEAVTTNGVPDDETVADDPAGDEEPVPERPPTAFGDRRETAIPRTDGGDPVRVPRDGGEPEES